MKIVSKCLIISLFVSICLLACRPDTGFDARNYYYPADQLDSGMVYEYELGRGGDLSIPDYWYYRNIYSNDTLYLIGQNYGPDLSVAQFINEELTPSGSLMRSGFLMSPPDSLGLQDRLPMKIDHKNIFPFRVKDSLTVYLYDASFQQDSVHYQIIRNRRFLSKEKRKVLGKEEDCLVFELKELTVISSNGVQEIEWRGKEYYAKDIGLVYSYKSSIGNENKIQQSYVLKDRYSMQEFEKKLIE